MPQKIPGVGSLFTMNQDITHQNRRACRATLRQAFTRVELLACIVALTVCFLLVLPAIAGSQSRSQSAQCQNNLRLIGRAVQMWRMEHSELVPWRTAEADGGTYRLPKVGNAFVEFGWMSNQLTTPRILACPADTGVKVATEFTGAEGYLTNPSYRGNATSYFINLESQGLYPPARIDQPLAALSGDRNINFDPQPTACSVGVLNAVRIVSVVPNRIERWTNGVHGPFGNVLFMDGSVSETSTPQLRQIFARSDDNGAIHFLTPR